MQNPTSLEVDSSGKPLSILLLPIMAANNVIYSNN